MKFDWTKERVGVLTKLWAEGVSTANIAARLGTEQNAVIGKAHRLKLPAHNNSCGRVNRYGKAARVRQTTPQKSGPALARKRIVSRGTHFAEGNQPSPVLPTMPDGSDTPAAQRCTLLQLSNDVCKWPFGEPQSPDFFFCGGGVVVGKPYCAEHCRVAYRGYWN